MMVVPREGTLELVATETEGEATKDAHLDLGLDNVQVWHDTLVDETVCREGADTSPGTIVVNSDGEEIPVPKPTDLQRIDYLSALVIRAPPGVGEAPLAGQVPHNLVSEARVRNTRDFIIFSRVNCQLSTPP